MKTHEKLENKIQTHMTRTAFEQKNTNQDTITFQKIRGKKPKLQEPYQNAEKKLKTIYKN